MESTDTDQPTNDKVPKSTKELDNVAAESHEEKIQVDRDVEVASADDESTGQQVDQEDPNVVWWDRPDDPEVR